MSGRRKATSAAGANGGGSACRVVIHLDLDCYYAQVEQRRLKIPADQPVAVQQWGSLLAVNYVARKFGVLRGAHAVVQLSWHAFDWMRFFVPVCG